MSNAVYPDIGTAGGGIGPSLDTGGIRKAPVFDTQKQVSSSGYEVRADRMSYPLYNITIGYALLLDDDTRDQNAADFGDPTNRFRRIWGFYLARQGSKDSFLLRDPQDDHVTDQLFGVGDATLTQFQLMRTTGIGQTFDEPVMNVNVITNIKKNGVALVNPTDYTISATGLVTLAVAPANGLLMTWTGTYYYRCRFVDDTQDFEQFLHNYWRLSQVKMYGCLGDKI